MFLIIRQNPVTGHSYVHTDGQHDLTFQSLRAAEHEAYIIKTRGGSHSARVLGGFKNARQGREYCRRIGEGATHEEALVASQSRGRE